MQLLQFKVTSKQIVCVFVSRCFETTNCIFLYNYLKRELLKVVAYNLRSTNILVVCFQVAPDRGSSAKNTLRISNQTPLGTFRGGSLPNVSAATPTVKTATHIKDSNKVISYFWGS